MSRTCQLVPATNRAVRRPSLLARQTFWPLSAAATAETVPGSSRHISGLETAVASATCRLSSVVRRPPAACASASRQITRQPRQIPQTPCVHQSSPPHPILSFALFFLSFFCRRRLCSDSCRIPSPIAKQHDQTDALPTHTHTQQPKQHRLSAGNSHLSRLRRCRRRDRCHCSAWPVLPFPSLPCPGWLPARPSTVFARRPFEPS